MPHCAVQEVQRFAVPMYLQVPGQQPAISELKQLGISFEGGPVTAVKLAEDKHRLIVRLWNVLDHSVSGSLEMPERFLRGLRRIRTAA